SDLDGTIASFSWSGSPDPEDVAKPVVNLGAGSHTFTLVVQDNQGADSAPDSVTIEVNEFAGNSAPVIAVDPSEYTVNEGEVLNFSVSASDPDNEPVSLTAAPLLVNSTFNSVN